VGSPEEEMNRVTALLCAGVILASSVWCASEAVGKTNEGRQGNWKTSAQGGLSVEETRKRLDKNPQDADAQNDYGWAVRQNGGNLADAEKALREAIKLKPQMPQAHSNLSVVLQDQNKTAEALDEARKAVSLDPNQPIYLVVLGNALAQDKQFKDAELAYRNAIKLRSDYENAYYHLGRVLHLAGQNVDAQRELSTALGLDPGDDRVIELLDKLFK
jgi:Flp pilus assembly protein TadD